MAKITVNLDAAAIGRLKEAQKTALVKTASEVLSRARNAAVMPFGDTGNLQNEDTSVDDSHASSGHVEIVTNAPQARRLYFNPQYNFRHDRNANAGGEWWEPWISGSRRNEPREIYEQFLKQDAKGLIR